MKAYVSRSHRRGRSQGANMHSGFGNTRNKQGRAHLNLRPSLVGTATSGKGSLAPAANAAKPPMPAPAPSKPPVGHPAAPDSLYYRQVDLANRQQESRLGQLSGQEQSIRHDFGIDDPTNPFSRAEGLKRAFLARQKATSATLASEGHLYSGQHERALARTRFDEEQARAELRSAFDQAIGQVGAAEAGVKFDTEEQKNQAFEDWLARAPQSEAAPPSPTPKPAPAPLMPPKRADQQIKAQTPKPSEAPGGGLTGEIKEPSITDPFAKQTAQRDQLHTLRQQLRQARKAGNKARVKRLRARIRKLR